MPGTLTWGPPKGGWPDLSSKSKRVGIDLDGCVYNFSEALRHFWGLPKEEAPVNRWRFYEDWGLNLHEFVALCDQAVDAGFLFGTGSGPPMPGSLATLVGLREAGHSLHIITDRSFGSRLNGFRSQEATLAWLEQYRVPFDTIDFSADKTIRSTDFFIDDWPKNVAALRAAGSQAFLLQAKPSKEDQEGFLLARPEWGVESWEEFYRKVKNG